MEYSHGGPADGVLRQYVSLPAEAVAKIPPTSSLNYAHWATLVASGTTTWNALYGNAPLKPGQTVLFQGTGGVSLLGLLIAKAAGAVTIITSSSDEKLRKVQELYGVDYTINYTVIPKCGDRALEITNGHGVDHILDIGGAGTLEQSLTAIAPGGVVSVIGFLATAKPSQMSNLALLILSKSAVVRGINLGPIGMLEEVVQFVGKRGLQMPVERTFGFSRDEVLKAYKYMSSAERIGEVCINIE